MNFATLQGLTIPEGVVTQITDASGRVLWAVRSGKMAVLQVEKITSDTYAGETTYKGEQFILLDIYPKTNGTVKVTYGGLTKTITDTSGAEEPNAQQVFFGTFNGVADSVTTPASGELTIEGDFVAFGCGAYVVSSKFNVMSPCGCVTAIIELGEIHYIPNNAFSNCDGLTSITIPNSVTSIGKNAFSNCDGLTSIVVDSKNQYYSSDGVALFNKDKTILMYVCVGFSGHYTIPDSVVNIGSNAFEGIANFNISDLPDSLEYIGDAAFKNCTSLSIESLPSHLRYIGSDAFEGIANFNISDLPDSLEYIGDAAFKNCTSLSIESLPSHLRYIGSDAFEGIANFNISDLPDSLEYIGDAAFKNCTSLSIESLPSHLRYIGSDAFEGTTVGSLDPLIIPEGVTSIGSRAFIYSKTKNIVLPSTVTFIGHQAFYAGSYGSGFNRVVKINAKVPPTLGTMTSSSRNVYSHFDNVEALTEIRVPTGCATAYKNDESWIAAGYTSKIVEAS